MIRPSLASLAPFDRKLVHILDRWGMYSSGADLNYAIGFVAGFDAATNCQMLLGFREWLLGRFPALEGPFAWMTLVETALAGHSGSETERVAEFFRLLRDFLQDRTARREG